MSLLPTAVRGILWALGWNTYPDGYFSSRMPGPRTVLLFSHSSYWDFFLFLLYKLAYPELPRLFAIMKPQPFRYAGSFLRYLGFIPATPLEERSRGFVSSTIEYLDNFPSFHLLISPKGTIVSAPWRTGYYYLAKGLDADIQVVGLDYHKKGVVIFPPQPLEDLPASNRVLMKDMATICPLYPQQELHPEGIYEVWPNDTYRDPGPDLPLFRTSPFSLEPLALLIVIAATIATLVSI
jgi:hypothetical protein